MNATETTTMTLVTNTQSDDGHTASESRQWDRINAAAKSCGVTLHTDESITGSREYNEVRGDEKSLARFERKINGMKRNPLDAEIR